MQLREVKLWPILLLLLFLFLQYRLWFLQGGVLEMLRTKKELTRQLQENAKLKTRNEILLSEVQHLQQHKDAVESRARSELGMIKNGETFYQVVN